MKYLAVIFFFFVSSSIFSANRYWIGIGDNNWNNSANWSTSSGGAGGASVPGSADLAIFDGNGNASCNLNATVNVLGFDIQSGYTSTITQNSGITITLGSSGFVQAHGTFVGGDQQFDNNSSFTLSGGVFTATSDTTFLKYSFIHTAGGSFNHGNGTFYLDTDNNFPTYNVNNNDTFYNVIYDHTSFGVQLTINSGDTLTVSNNFSWRNGNIINGVIDVKGDVEVLSTADGQSGSTNTTLRASGTTTQNGTLYAGGKCGTLIIANNDASFSSSGAGTFTFGTALQIDSGSLDMGTLNYNVGAWLSAGGMTLNNGTFDATTGGNLTIVGNLTFNGDTFIAPAGDINVDGSYVQSIGIFTGNTGEVSIDDDFTISGGTYTAASNITTIGKSYIQSNGTFSGNGARVNINEDYTLSGGTYTATSDTTWLIRSFTHTAGGTFNHNNGTFFFNSPSIGAVYDVDNNENFYNVTYQNQAPTSFHHLSFSAGDTLTVENDFYWVNGEFSGGVVDVKGRIEVLAGADGRRSGTPTLIASGSGAQTGVLHGGGKCGKLIINNSNANFSSSGTGTFTFDIALQIDSGSLNMGTLNFLVGNEVNDGLTLNAGTFDGSTGGSLTVKNDLTINGGSFTAPAGNTLISGNFNQTNGTFTGNGEQVDIDGSFTLSGGTHTATSDTTFLKRNYTHIGGGDFNHGNGTFYFDTDNNSSYNVNVNDTFYNVIYDHTSFGVNLNMDAGDTMTVNNDFSWRNGFLYQGVVDVKGDVEVLSTADGQSGATNTTLRASGTTLQIGTLHGGGNCGTLIIANNNASFSSPGTGTFTCKTALQIDAGSLNMGTLNYNIGAWLSAGGMTLNGGTFDGTTGGNLVIDGEVIVNGGNHTAPAGFTTMSRSYTHTSGTFTGNIGTIDITSNFVFSGGNYTAASNTTTIGISYTQSNGTFLGNGARMNIGKDFTLSGGTYTATSDTTLLEEDFIHTSGGTFNHNNGTFFFYSYYANALYDVDNNDNFYDVIYENQLPNFISSLTFAAGDTLTVLNDFLWVNEKMSNGVVDVKGDIEVLSNADGQRFGSPVLRASGNGIQTGTLHAGGECGTLLLSNSDATMNTTGSGTFTCETSLQIDSGTFNMGTIGLSIGTIIAGGLTQNSGTFNGVSGRNLSIANDLTINGGTFTTAAGNTYIANDFVQTGGTFSGNGEQVDIDGSFNLSGGTYTSTADTTFLERNFTHTAGGSFNHGNGTFYFDTDNNRNYNVNANDTFYNVTYNHTSFAVNLSFGVGDTLTVANDLSLVNGALQNGFINTKNDVNVLSTFDGGSSALVFSGSAGQNLNNVGAEGNFNGDVYIDMNGASDSVVLASNFIFDGAGQDLTFVKGRFNTTAPKKIIMHDGRNVSGASDSSFVDGPFMKIGNDAFTFPTGDSSSYLPIAISAPSSVTDTFTAQYFQVNPDPPYDRSLTDTTMAVSACEYWNLDRNAGGSDVTVTLSWKDYAPGQPCSGVADLPGLRVARWDGAQWVNEKNMGTTGNTSSGTINSRVVSSFGSFTLASQPGLNPLPVEITQFDAEEMDNVSVLVSWTTEVEISNHYFLVQRSTDLVNWEDVSTVLSQAYFNSGNSSAPLHYETYDFAPHFGTSYYRLKQFDINGDVDIPANPKSVYFQGLEIVNVYPNPAENQMNYIVNVHTEGDLDVFVYDSKGRVISKETYNIEWGINRFTMDVSRFADGVYLLKVATPNHKHYDFKQFITNRP